MYRVNVHVHVCMYALKVPMEPFVTVMMKIHVQCIFASLEDWIYTRNTTTS